MSTRIALALCLLAPAATLAAPSAEVKALREEVAALQLDHALNLTQQQARALLPILQAARARVQAMQAQREAAQPAIAAALAQAVADLKATGVVAPTTVEALRAAGGGPGTLRQDLKGFLQQARALLTPEQLASLRTARLGAGMPPAPEGPAGMMAGREGRPGRMGGLRRLAMLHTVVSDPFLSLVQARAG